LLHETSMRLRRRPRAPLGASWSILAAGSVPGDWQPFLVDTTFGVEAEAAAV
jgi:hypothetical protein